MAYEAYVAELLKLGEACAGLTRNAYKPVEQAAADFEAPSSTKDLRSASEVFRVEPRFHFVASEGRIASRHLFDPPTPKETSPTPKAVLALFGASQRHGSSSSLVKSASSSASFAFNFAMVEEVVSVGAGPSRL